MAEQTKRTNGRRRWWIAALLLIVLLSAVWMVFVRGGSSYDYIRAKAEELGFEPDRIAEFMRKDVAEHGYEGYLRGPVGTLWAGAGSRVDRAALWAALLRASGHDARLAGEGDRCWVQLRDGDKWTDLTPDGAKAPAAKWTGEIVPDAQQHLLDVAVDVDGTKGQDQAKATYRVADLSHHPLVLSFGPAGKWRLAPLGLEGPVVEGQCGRSDDETLTLRFTYRPPGDSEPVRFRREIYTGRYKGYRKLADPSNVHVIVVAPGRLQPWAAAKERELAGASAERTGRDVAAAYALALAHIEASDRALKDLTAHFKTTAYYAGPRVVIGSACYLDKAADGEERRPTFALDLRRNLIHVDGADEVRAGFGIARAALEAQLEGRTLETATGGPAFVALDAFNEHLEQRRASSQKRVHLYLDLLQRLVGEARTGAKLTVALDEKRKVVFQHGTDKNIRVVSISEDLRTAMKGAEVPWEALTAKTIGPDRFEQAALELESLFGPVAGAALDYVPSVNFEESVTNLVAPNVRIFTWRTKKGHKDLVLTLEYQFIEAKDKGDVRYESVDHWDEHNNRAYRYAGRFTIPEKTIESSHVMSLYYDQRRFNRGDMFMMFSRQMVRELKEQGYTIVRYRDGRSRLLEPMKLYLCSRSEETVYINNQARKVPVLKVAGGYVKDNLPRQAYDKVTLIRDENHPTKAVINRYTMLDNPLYPMLSMRRKRVQTAMPGRVVSKRTKIGVPGAKVSIAGTRGSGTTWADGRFLLPVIKKPFGKFTVTVTAPGYAPFSEEMDLARADAFPINIQLTPGPITNEFIWVGRTDLAKLAQIDNPRVRDLIRTAIEDDPKLVALVPARRAQYGQGSAHAWLLFNPARFHFTAVSEDGLHGAAGDLARWTGAHGGATAPHQGAISFHSGFIASWYAYSAGKLDALSEMIEGKEFKDVGHAHAIKFAMDFLNSMSDRLDSYPAKLFGAHGALYRAGFLAGLQFFEKNPVYRGE